MNTNTEKNGKQPSTPQTPEKTPGFAKSPSGFPEEPRANQDPDKLHTPGKTPVGGTPSKSAEPIKLPGNDKENMGQKNPRPEEQDKRDTHSTGKAWSPATNPDEHGTAQQKKDIKDNSTTPDPTEPEGPQPGKHTPEREGQQEEETKMPDTPPSEWEVKGGKNKPTENEKTPDSKQRPEQGSAQESQRRGL